MERAQFTHKDEFYQILDPPDSLDDLRPLLLAQALCYNSIRPHQALGHLTPRQWLGSIPGKAGSIRHVPDEYTKLRE
jgi:transposase InsO family protein